MGKHRIPKSQFFNPDYQHGPVHHTVYDKDGNVILEEIIIVEEDDEKIVKHHFNYYPRG